MIGVLLNNQWSVGGNPLRPPVNAFLAQPFVNYNMAHGWYLTSSPIITVNWLAASGEQMDCAGRRRIRSRFQSG